MAAKDRLNGGEIAFADFDLLHGLLACWCMSNPLHALEQMGGYPDTHEAFLRRNQRGREASIDW